MAACRDFPGLFPSVLLAQGILESGNGNSSLAAKHNNHFGIKRGVGWTGKVVSLNTKEVFDGRTVTIKDGFRVYDSAEQGFRDRNTFLKMNPRYQKAGVFDAPTPEEQAKRLKAAGYATDPHYAEKLIAIITSNHLHQFDTHV